MATSEARKLRTKPTASSLLDLCPQVVKKLLRECLQAWDDRCRDRAPQRGCRRGRPQDRCLRGGVATDRRHWPRVGPADGRLLAPDGSRRLAGDGGLVRAVRQAEADFVVPDGLDEATVAQLKAEAMARVCSIRPRKRPSHASTRPPRNAVSSVVEGVRQVQKDAPSRMPMDNSETLKKTMASFFQMEKALDQREARLKEVDKMASTMPPMPRNRVDSRHQTPIDHIFDVPISVGKRR